jgi:hypothetical protein
MILDNVILNLVINEKSFVLFLIDNNIFTKNELDNYNTIDHIINVTINHLFQHFLYLQYEITANRLNNIDELTFLKYFMQKKDKLLLSNNDFKFSSNHYECIISSIAISHLYYYKQGLSNETSITHKNKIMASFKTI